MSTKDTLLAGINADVAKAGNLKREDYYKDALNVYAPNLEATKSAINSSHDAAKTNTQAQHDKAVNDTKVAYESEYERNAVQKLINEKQVAEKMANLGLTDSGLNRTQQTAVQLSYANQKGKIDLARQSALDDLTLNLTSALTDIETSRSSALLAADEKWNDKAISLGETNYNNDLTAINSRITSAYEQYGDIVQAEIDAAAEVQKAAISASAETKASNILNSKYSTLGNLQGSFASNGITSIHNADGTTTYTDTITGYSVTMDEGVNPFTGQNNLTENTETAKAAQKYGTFSNGYQPMGITGHGIVTKTGDKTYVDGRKQNIWKTPDGTEWIWRGVKNCYVEYMEED